MIALGWFRRPNPIVGYALVTVGVLLAVLLPQTSASDSDPIFGSDNLPWLAESFEDSELLFGLYTAVIFGLAVLTIVMGQRHKIPALVNAGIAIVAVLTISIYIGRLAGTLETSLAVLLGGVLLVG